MAVVQCDTGHYFDNEKFAACPHCAPTSHVVGGGTAQNDHDDEKTVAMPLSVPSLKPSSNLATNEATQQLVVAFFGEQAQPSQGQDVKTVALFKKTLGYDPVVGWLVCVAGAEKGRDYRLHAGRNFIGRAASMDVSIVDDEQISRDNHASIVFEPRKSVYTIVVGSGTTIFVNDKQIIDDATITDMDRIGMGSSTFIFTAFCKGGVTW